MIINFNLIKNIPSVKIIIEIELGHNIFIFLNFHIIVKVFSF
jgi:hypothetical protein